MCGIVGFTGKYADRREIVKKMQNRIIHRGPDGQNSYVDEGVALGHVRLSIIDIQGGIQPMQNEDGGLTVVFNGEIYNYRELQMELIAMGHHFRSRSDTEVLLHGYEAWGTELMDYLRGMFAFVIWDRKKQKLFGARDFFGIKPLYYTLMGGELMFASEIKAFLDHPLFKKELNEERLADYMTFGCVPGTETMFKNVFKLAPGHYFEFENGIMSITRYYQAAFHPDNEKSFNQMRDELEDRVRDSICAHEIADVEVGCFLSSGVDSSYVASQLAKHQKINTYSVGFASEKYDESSDAARIAEHLHVTNYRSIIDADDYFESLPKAQYYLDEPLGNPSANSLWHLCQLAGEDLKVVLSGEGADEMFGGYCVYQEPLALEKYQKLPLSLRRRLGETARKLPDFKGRNFLIRGSQTVEERYIGNSNVYKVGEREQYLKHHYEARTPQYYTKPYYEKAFAYDDITKMQYLDIHGWMVQEILLKADKMSMAHSLELRVPYLDREIFDLACTIPTKYRVSKANTKLLFRAAAGKELDPEIAERRKKAFPLPLGEWVRQNKYYEMIRDAFTSDTAYKFFEIDKLVELLDNHRRGKRMCLSKIWIVYSFIIWYDQFF
ncbi:MAG: asparagine synthase (glutamine-hydrolyzing) [Coprococcus sp.]